MTKEEAINSLELYKNTLKALMLFIAEADGLDCFNLDEEPFRMAEEALKSQKTRHWILDETDNSITCDKCGCLIWANDISNGEAHYCPNCGAKMEAEE